MAYEPTLDDVLNSLYGPEGGLTEEELAQYMPEPYAAPEYTPAEMPQGVGYAPVAQGDVKLGGPRTPYDDLIYQKAVAAGQDPNLIKAQIWAESTFNPKAVSHAGAQGLTQFMPGTWRKYGRGSPFDPNAAIDAQLAYNADLLRMFGGDERKVLAAYNWGEHRKAYALPDWERHAPAETRDYVQKILAKRDQYAGTANRSYPIATQAQPQESPFDIVRLSDGSAVEVEKGTDLASVADILKKSGVQAEPIKNVALPNGSYVEAPYSYSDDQVFGIVRKSKPELFGEQPEDAKHGYGAAAKSSFEAGIGSVFTGLGGLGTELGKRVDSPLARQAGEYLTGKGKEWQKMGEEAYQELTPEEAKAMGFEGQFRKYVGEPVAGFVGSMGAALPALALPGGAATRVGAFATQELGGQLAEQERMGQAPDVEKALPYAVGSGIVQNSLLGPLKYVTKAFGKPDVLAKIAEITEKEGADAAKQYAGGVMKNILKETGVNTGEVVVSEVISRAAERAASGQPLDTPDAISEYEDIAIKSAPGGLLGIPGAYGVHAAKQGTIEEVQLAQAQEAQNIRIAEEQKAAEEQAAVANEEQAAADAELERQAGIGVEAAPIPEPTIRGKENVAPTEPPLVAEEQLPPVEPVSAPPPVTPEIAPEAVQAEPEVTEEIPEPTIRGKEPKLPEAVAPEVTNPADILGLNNRSGLRKQLQGFDINNVEDHPKIEGILQKTSATFSAENLANLENKMEEVQSANGIQKPAEIDAGSFEQPQVRQEGGDQTISSEGVRSSGQEVGAVKVPEIQEIETVEAPKLPAEQKYAAAREERMKQAELRKTQAFNMSLNDLQDLREDAKAENERLDLSAIEKHFGKEQADAYRKMNVFQRNRWWDENATDALEDDSSVMQGIDESEIDEYINALSAADGDNAKNLGYNIGLYLKNSNKPEWIHSPEHAAIKAAFDFADKKGWNRSEVIEGMRQRVVRYAGADAPELFERLFRVTPEMQKPSTEAPKLEIPKAPQAEVTLPPVAQKAPEITPPAQEGKAPVSVKKLKDALAERITAVQDTLREVNGLIKTEQAKPKPNPALLSQYETRQRTAEQVFGNLKKQQSQQMQAKDAQRRAEAEQTAEIARAEAARKVQEQGGFEEDLIAAEKAAKRAERVEAPTLAKPVKEKLKAVPTEEDLFKRIEEMQAKNKEIKPEVGKQPAKGEADVANPHTKETINQELKKLYGENAPQIEVSDRATEKTDAATKGFFEPSTGRAVLVADSIGRGENLHGLLRHEVAVHAKKLGKSDKEFQDILKQVDNLKAQGAKDVAEAFDRVPKDTKAEDVTHEALAYLVQHKPDLPVVKRFMSWLRRTANKLTGNAKWLKGDDFAVMADAVLKKAAKEAKTEIKVGKAEERQYSKAPLVKETEAESSLKRGMNAAVKAFEGNLWTKLETNYVNRHAALANAIKDKATIDSNGKYRADLVGSANDQIFNVISAGITDGVPVFSRAGTVMIQKDAKKNLSNIAKRIDKLNVKNPRVFVGEIARALRGESLKKEDAEAIKQIDILEDKAKKLKAYAKTQAFAEGKKADTLANRYLAEAKKLKGRVGEEGREKLVTDEDILEAKRRLAEHPEIQKILDDVHGLMNSLVDLWEASGLVSKDVANEWRSKPSYIPLYMSQEDILSDPSRVVRAMGGGAKSLPNVKTLKGGTHAINLLENLQKHYAFMTSAAAQNSYRKAAARDLELFGAAQRTSPDDKNAIMFKENGKEIYYKISDPLMFEAFQAAAPLTNPLLKAAREYTKAFRAVTLVNPLYWYRQLIRDPIHANVVSQTGMVTPIGATISFAKIIAGASPEYAELRRRGVVGAVDSLSDPARFKKIYDKGPHLFKKGADWVMHVHEAADAATRVEVYKAAVKEAKKKGMSREQAKDYATMRAREIINFANQGRSETLQAIRATVPFFSAALNSLDSVARAAAGKGLNRREAAEARRLFTSRMLMIASFTTAYALAMQDDEDYLKSPDSINNWLIPTGDKENPFIMIPLPFELGFVGKVIPELIVRLNSGTLTAYEGKKALKEAAGATLTPPLPFPQVIKPIVEAAINYDLHQGRPIVSPSEQGKLPEEQTKGASALSIEVGRKLGLSPAQIEHFGRGYMTELWTAVGVLSDAFLPAGQYKEAKNIAEVPTLLGGAKGILSKPDRDRDMDIFYELSNGAQQIKRSMTAAQNKGDVDAMERIMADPEKKKRFYASDVGREIGDELSEVNTAIEQIRNDKSITAPKKQEMIREKQQYKNQLATQGKEWFYSLGVNEP